MIQLPRIWPFGWSNPAFAFSCAMVQLSGLREAASPMYLPDDATEEELADMAAEQRELSGR